MPAGVDVVVRVDQQPIHEVRATLLSLQSMVTGRQVVVDLRARLEIAALAAEFRIGYAATDLTDRNGLKTSSVATTAPVFLLLDAGDIPSPDAIGSLMPLMTDDRVAVVIGQSVMADDDSAEHGPNGLHELTFERETLNPALGARGAAILGESGALIRRAAIDSVEVGDEESLEAEAYWSMASDGAGMEGGRCFRRSGRGPPCRALAGRRVRTACAPSAGAAHPDVRPGRDRRLELAAPRPALGDCRVGGSSVVGFAAKRVHRRRRRLAADRLRAAAPGPDRLCRAVGPWLGPHCLRSRVDERLDAAPRRSHALFTAQPRRVVAGFASPDRLRPAPCADHDPARSAARWCAGRIGGRAEFGDDAPWAERAIHARPRKDAAPMARRARRGVAVVAGHGARRVAHVRQAQPAPAGGARGRVDPGRGRRQPGCDVRCDCAGGGLRDQSGSRCQAEAPPQGDDHHSRGVARR